MAAWKPAGYPDLSPYLVCTGAQRVIDFAAAVFGAEVLRRYDMPDGSIMHAELRVGDSVVMLGEAGGEWPADPGTMHVYVPDVDETYRKALAAGGISLAAPEQKGDPDKRGGVKDPAGNSWWFATQQG